MGRRIEVFNGFIGQRRNVRLLKHYITNAKSAGKPLPHTLFTGDPGTGKTQLAQAVAAEIGTGYHQYCANPSLSAFSLAGMVPAWKPHDVVCFDESQSLTDDFQERLCRVLNEGKAPSVDASGPKPRLGKNEITVPPITLIACTDQPSELLKSLKSRFVLQLPFDPYSIREMKTIVEQSASRAKLLLSPQAARHLAASCRGNPRVACQRVTLLKLFYQDSPASELSPKKVKFFLKKNGIDDSGMTREDRRYLEFLAKHKEHAVSRRTVALGIRADEQYLTTFVEPWLLNCGWIDISPSGRFLTQAGKKFLAQEKEPQ